MQPRRSPYPPLVVALPLLLSGVIAASAPPLAAQDLRPPLQATLKGSAGSHRFTVVLAKRAFRRQQHTVTANKKRDGGYPFLVDGQPPLGTDGGLPYEELYRFDVQVDSRRWNIPPRLWRDCYDPNLSTPRQDPEVQAMLSQDGKRLTVKMLGSDGAGSYTAVWHLRADGHHTREITSGD